MPGIKNTDVLAEKHGSGKCGFGWYGVPQSQIIIRSHHHKQVHHGWPKFI
jgi:hypothetical protein